LSKKRGNWGGEGFRSINLTFYELFEKGVRCDSKAGRFDFEIVRYDVEIVHDDPENTGINLFSLPR
jgi:hypothetical protein